MPRRVVKLGRFMIAPVVAYHWAIKVGDTWYEISKTMYPISMIRRSKGDAAASGAGSLGGEIVGVTVKTDQEIDTWLQTWLSHHPDYDFIKDNCQKLSFDFMVWLTDGNYRCDHRVDAGNIDSADKEPFFSNDGFAAAQDGNAIASYGLGQGHASAGPANLKAKLLQLDAQAVCGPGFGAFVDANVADIKVSLGNVVGAHVGLNANTGAGVRNGNIEAHLLGFGGKIGADGVEINTPIGGVNACSVM